MLPELARSHLSCVLSSRREARPGSPACVWVRADRVSGAVKEKERCVGSGPPRGPPPFPRCLPSLASGRRRAATAGGSRASASFPSGSSVFVCTGVVRAGALFTRPGRWLGCAGSPGTPAAAPASRCRSVWRARVGDLGWARPSRPAFWLRVSAPLLSGYLAVAFRRGGLKTPWGSPFRPRGRGGGGARRRVGPEGFPVPPRPAHSDSTTPPRCRRRSRGLRSGGVLRREPPLGARGVRTARPARPLFADCRRRPCRVPCRSRSVFSRSRPCLSKPRRVSFRFLAGRPEANPPVPSSLCGGGRAGATVCRRQHP